LTEISDSDLQAKLVNFFTEYCTPPVEPEEGEEKKEQIKDFKTLVEIHNTTKLETGVATSYEDIIFHFLTKIFDKKEEELVEDLPRFFAELIKSSTIPKGAWNTGVSRFV
jgi:hypothetical protein